MVTTRRQRAGPSSDPHRRPPAVPTQFFKVVLPSAIERKMLMIPPEFVKKFGSELSDVATLATPAGFKRRIRLKRVGEEIWFHGGWPEFAEFHSISKGHFLVFDYRGNSAFQVLIFDMTACEIDYPRDCIDISEGDDEMEDEDEGFLASQDTKHEKTEIFDGSVKCDSTPMASNSGLGTYKYKNSACSLDGSREKVIELDESYESDESLHIKMGRVEKIEPTVETWSKTQAQGKKLMYNRDEGGQFTKLESNDAEKPEPFELHQEGGKVFVSRKFYNQTAAVNKLREAEMLRLKNPSFMVIVRAYKFHNSPVYVPAKFVRSYLTRAAKHFRIQDPNGRNWLLEVNKRRDYIQLRKGWPEVSRANDLKCGDRCVFELIQGEENIGFKLHVFRLG